MTYIEIVNNHIIAKTEGKIILVDISALTSIGLGNLTIGKKAYRLSGSNSY
ncbi:MAG: hypothetical protein JW902_01965 [Syntrophaceae bacterium]|nr:hypothetical protein [Syntrophaceae bacterium]